MKKVLVLSYFFPPANLAGCYRVESWAKHLHKFGYYPVIVTRCWNQDQTEVTDDLLENIFSHERHSTYEIYRLPYQHNLRDKLQYKFGAKRFVFFRKLLTFFELLFQHYSDRAIPYHNLYDFSRDLIKKENDFHCLIVSGKPFQLFKFADLLHKETGIKWIGDYRDEWNTGQWTNESFSQRLIRTIESRSEKKWTQSVSVFTTCSEDWVQNIARFINKPGKVVLNGYEDNLMAISDRVNESGVFTIAYNGTLLSTQQIEIFLDGFKGFIRETPDANVKLLFPGIENDYEQGIRIKKILTGYEKYYQTSARVPKHQLLEILASAHLFLLVGSGVDSGHYSSKIFEYLALQRPIMLCPDDQNVMGDLIRTTNTGAILNSEADVKMFLDKAYLDFKTKVKLPYSPDMEKIKLYSREKQAEMLARIMDDLEHYPANNKV